MPKVFFTFIVKIILVAALSVLTATPVTVLAVADKQQQTVIGKKRAAAIAQSQVAGKLLKVTLKNGTYQVRILQGDKVKHIRIDAYSGAIL